MPLTMTYGSFGCSQEDWCAEGNPILDASGGTCGPRTDLITGAYDVVISSKLLSRFTCTSIPLTYYIALEPDSTFE